MFNTTIPFSRLLSGILSIVWIILFYLFILDMSFKEALDVLTSYKDISLFIASFLVLLAYPIGIVISYISYHATDKMIYQLFIYRKQAFDKPGHRQRVERLSLDSPKRLNTRMKEKTQELSILGTCGINFLIITIILFLKIKFDVTVFFSLGFTIVFFTSVIAKYKLWYEYVKKIVNFC